MKPSSILARAAALLALASPTLAFQNAANSLIIDAILIEDGDPWISLANADRFGESICSVGDLDGNGIEDIAVGAIGDDLQSPDNGAIWVLFMEATGEPSFALKYDGTFFLGGPGMGLSLANIGDLDGDGIDDMAVGRRAGLMIFFMTSSGTPHTVTFIEDGVGGFTGPSADRFGWSVASLGDFDLDGTPDILVGDRGDDDGATNAGAVWILLMNSDGTVKSEQKISNTQGNLFWTLDADDDFGTSMTSLGDINHDGVIDIAVGAPGDDDGASSAGAVYILFLNANMTVGNSAKIGKASGGLSGNIASGDRFGAALTSLGDVDGDGTTDIAVGAPFNSVTNHATSGAVWILTLRIDGTVGTDVEIDGEQEILRNQVATSGQMGNALCPIGDLDGDGISELGVVGRATARRARVAAWSTSSSRATTCTRRRRTRAAASTRAARW